MNKTINLFDLLIPNYGKVKLIGAQEATASVKWLTPHHFEMSNIHGEFDAAGSRVWANTEYEIFCKQYGVKLEIVSP